jgi:energy-coupling factor transport system permease protein
LFNALTTHFGETVLFSLPEIIPLLGGPITVEALLYGMTNGLVLATLFAAFTVLNLAVPIRDLIRIIPRAFYPVALVLSIAVTFVPTTLRQIRQIREAQAVRGHRMKGLRDWFPLFMPLLVGGLERALQLAEAMTARGFASKSAATNEGTPSHDPSAQIGSIFALLLLLAGALLHTMWGRSLWGAFLMLLGTGLLYWVLRRVGRRVQYTVYRKLPWTQRDWMVVIGAVASIVPLLLLGENVRYYTPYPLVELPRFHPGAGITLLGLMLPALLVLKHQEKIS